MIKYRTILALFMAALLMTNLFAEETYVYPNQENPVLSISFPDEWKVEPEENILHATPKDESIYVALWALDDVENLEAALESVDKLVSPMIDEFLADEPEKVEFNNILYYFIEGSGKDNDGEDVNASVAIFTPDGETVCLIITYGTPEADEEHEEDFMNIIKSIKGKSDK